MRYVRSYPGQLPALAELLPQISTPVTIVNGRHDRVVPVANSEFLDDRLPNSRLVLIDAGHFVWEEAPAEYASTILESFCEAAAEVGNGALRRAARAGSAGGVPQRGNDSWISGWRRKQEMCRHELRAPSGRVEELCGAGVAAVPLCQREGFVDGSADERMSEPERRLGPQDVDLGQRHRHFGGRFVVQAYQFGCLARLRVVAQDGDCPCQPGGLER
jgi:hypothetical protein